VATVAIVGAGPGGTSFLERLLASVPELLGDQALDVHIVDPFPPGPGRVWRYEQSALLRMNSMAEDVTMFTDDSVRCEGPIRPGPSLSEWAGEVRGQPQVTPELTAEVAALTPTTFPSRQLQSAYLAWVFDRVAAGRPDGVTLHLHRARATAIDDAPDGSQLLTLEGEPTLRADVVVLALGHLDVDPTGPEADLAAFAAEHGLFYLPPEYSADVDLGAVPAGADIVVRGMGLAFIDLMILLTEGRGGTFAADAGGVLVYHPSGGEPRLHVGSRRGVPYHAKTSYRLQGAPLELPTFLATDAVAAFLADHPQVHFRRHVWPLLAKEICWGYYQELFSGHPERTAMPWPAFAERYREVGWGTDAFAALVAEAVPADDDRLDLDHLDRPLRGRRFATDEELQDHLVAYIEADLARRSDPAYSADLGAFMALLSSFRQLARIVASGQLGSRSRVDEMDGWWFGFFSYLASGPPPDRLEQLVALARAGVVHFLGGDLEVVPDAAVRRFVARGQNGPTVVDAVGLIEARLPKANVRCARDELVRSLVTRGEGVEERLPDEDDGDGISTGRLMVSAEQLRLLDRDGQPHPRRIALGAHTSRAAAGAFSRPRTNAPAFRQHDAAARAILVQLATLGPAVPG
jgi:uncharacterized NAD(P)/FAD-binding protein YdhS